MPKESSKRVSGSPASLEAKIDRLDREILRLVQERAELYVELYRHRPAEQVPPTVLPEAQDRVAELIQGASVPLSEGVLRSIMREVRSGCRALVRPTRVAFLGPLYTYSHLAALHAFGQSVEFVPVGSIAAVFEEVHRRQADYGLVPIENSTDGRIADTLEMFTRLPVRICGDVELEIHHALLAKCSRQEIQEVYSRPQALSQCRNWLAKHLPQARTFEVTSTATAAQLARDKPGAAAIASVQAGIYYGLDVLAEQIEDNPGNTTRFAVIGHKSNPRTGHDKTAMLFQTEHRPGALAEALNIFKRHRLNLTWIESFPVPGQKRTYLFFVEFEGHETEARVRRALSALQRKTLRMEILGSYPMTLPVQ